MAWEPKIHVYSEYFPPAQMRCVTAGHAAFKSNNLTVENVPMTAYYCIHRHGKARLPFHNFNN